MKRIAVVLSGGQSRRMGRDKAGLDFGGKPMLARLVDAYRPCFDEIYVSVNRAGRFDTAGAGEIVDRRPGLGPMAALESVFLETDGDVAFLTATDLPFGDPAAARALAEGCVGHDACLLSEDEPLFAAYSRSCLPAVTQALDRDERRLRRLLRGLDRAILPWPADRAARILTNVNDPEQYRLALELLNEKER
jgi:molybdopterin-guanine dinucleotide biosynthesis protein A